MRTFFDFDGINAEITSFAHEEKDYNEHKERAFFEWLESGTASAAFKGYYNTESALADK